MMNRSSYYVSAALALLLTGERLAKADVYVCGTDYADAAKNCIVNTACPAGDGCSTDQTCFALPDESCIQAPMVALNTTDLYVCGIDLEDALTNCHSEDDYCTDVTDTTAYCKSSGEVVTRSCFIIPYAECPATTEPTTTSSPSISVSPTMSALPTTPPLLFVCGTDYSDAASNFCSLKTCPTGDGCGDGMTCFAVPGASCDIQPTISPSIFDLDLSLSMSMSLELSMSMDITTQPSLSPSASVSVPAYQLLAPQTTQAPIASLGLDDFSLSMSLSIDLSMSFSDAPTAPTSLSPTPAMLYVCGVDYSDASTNHCSLTSCPTGDGCEVGSTCYAIPFAPCSPTVSPTGSLEPTTTASSVPVFDPDNLFYCGVTYDDAITNCYNLTACPDGVQDDCPTGTTCYPVKSCVAPAASPLLSNVTVVTNVSMGSGIDSSSLVSNSFSETVEMDNADWDADLYWENIENSSTSMKIVSLTTLALVGAVLVFCCC